MRPKHRGSVDGWYSAVHKSGFSSDVTFLVLHYPRSLRPKPRHSVAGWYPAVHVFLFPSSGATFSGAPSFVPCVPLHQYFLPSGLVTVRPRISPYQRRLRLNYQSRGVGWSIASFGVDVYNSSIFDPLPDFLMP